MANVAWFRDLSKDDIGIAGGKGANLAEMYNARFPIPPGFIVTAQAYKHFLDFTGVQSEIKRILNNLDVENNDLLQEASEKIQNLIEKQKMPSDIKEDIIEAYDTMNISTDVLKAANKSTLGFIKAGRDLPFVAVRSSATFEDLPTASFAGQQATFVNVRGKEDVVAAVQQCWASLFTARAIYYRVKNNFPHEKVLIAVVIQKMINSDRSGIMFSANPATSDTSEIVIEAGFGLGDAIVSGSVNPDTYIIDKATLSIKSKKVAKQDWMFTRDENIGRTIKRNLSESKGREQKLSDAEIRNLASFAVSIEQHYDKPQDMEFALDGGKIYIVQSRPITTLKEKTQETQAQDSIPAGEPILSGLGASPGVATGTVKIVSSVHDLSKVEKGNILVALMTNPDYVPAMERAAAIVTSEGGVTSHAAIVTRELAVPCVVGTEKATEVLHDGDVITVDGMHGKVYMGAVAVEQAPQDQVVNVNEVMMSDFETVTKVKVIADLPHMAQRVAATNPDGIGLVRIEFMIAANGVHPAKYIRDGREEDYINLLVHNLSEMARHFEGKPIWVRTSDIRTDEYRELEGGSDEPHEANPMLGWHGIRRGLDDVGILRAEFKAIKRLHEMGYTNVGIMVPFLISVDELRRSKEICREVGLEPLRDVEFGVMIETPASVWVIDELCKEGISFISFGTNDLTQTTLGVDRGNERIQKLYDEMNTAVLRSIEHVVKVCQKFNVKTSICGQAGSREDMASFLVKIGIDSISANMDAVQKIKQTVAREEKKLILSVVRKYNLK